jgi:hypothetical protein
METMKTKPRKIVTADAGRTSAKTVQKMEALIAIILEAGKVTPAAVSARGAIMEPGDVTAVPQLLCPPEGHDGSCRCYSSAPAAVPARGAMVDPAGVTAVPPAAVPAKGARMDPADVTAVPPAAVPTREAMADPRDVGAVPPAAVAARGAMMDPDPGGVIRLFTQEGPWWIF